MATSVAIAMAKARRDVASHFLSRNAVSPETAVPYVAERRLRRRMFEQLRTADVVRPGTSGGFYIDVPAWEAYARKRRRRAGAIIGLTLAMTGAMVAIFA